MPEKEPSQNPELRNSVVRECSSLVSFLSKYADAYMRRLYHVYIVSTISNGQNNLILHSIHNKFNDAGLLTRRATIYNNRLAFPKGLNQKCLCFKISGESYELGG